MNKMITKLQSNSAVKKNSIFNSIKELLYEEGLSKNNSKKAMNKLKKENIGLKKDAKKVINADKALEEMGSDAIYRDNYSEMKNIAKELSPKKGSKIDSRLSKDFEEGASREIMKKATNKSFIKDSTDPLANKTRSIKSEYIKASGGLYKDKGVGMFKDYYVQPFKNKDYKKFGARVGATAAGVGSAGIGVYGGTNIVKSAFRDDE